MNQTLLTIDAATAMIALFAPYLALEAKEQRLQMMILLLPDRRPCGLNERGLQPLPLPIFVFRRFPALPSARGDSPAQETRWAEQGEASHVHPDLGDDDQGSPSAIRVPGPISVPGGSALR